MTMTVSNLEKKAQRERITAFSAKNALYCQQLGDSYC
jgi:hypothetical protein